MCWNCVFNPLTVLIDDKVSRALEHPEMMRVIHQIVAEVAAVSAAVEGPLAVRHARPGGEVDSGNPGHPHLHVRRLEGRTANGN
jgi:ketopantoate reductase